MKLMLEAHWIANLRNSMTNQIQIAQAWEKVKGAEKSPWVLAEYYDEVLAPDSEFIIRPILRQPKYNNFKEVYGPWLRNSVFDGKWSSASIREGLGLTIGQSDFIKTDGKSPWLVQCGNQPFMVLCLTDPETKEQIPLTDPAADEYAIQLGIIKFWESSDENKKKVESYLEGLR